MSDYFPLSSGWETDQWTLFIDENDVLVDGVSTKAMVDTRDARALFWTNDENGVRLHAIWTPQDQWIDFSQPVLLANAFCKVGDRYETIYTQNGEQLVFSVHLTGLENISTTTGTFYNCLKLRVHAYPVGDLPEDYGYETVWLARDVGLVKAESDSSRYHDLLAKPGEVRRLISYFHTPAVFSAEEAAVRQAYIQWINFLNAEDIVGLESMIHDDYDEKCRNKTDAVADWTTFFADSADYVRFASIEQVDIIGDEAFLLGECQESYRDLPTSEPTRHWSRKTVRLKRDALSGEWKIYGDQFPVYPSFVSVYPRVTPTVATFASPVEITDCSTGDWPDTDAAIASLTLTGTPQSGIVDAAIPWDPITGWNGFWQEFEIDRARSGFHTFEVVDVNGNYLLYTDYLLASAPLAMPLLVDPAADAVGVPTDVTFRWQPVAGANRYKLEVYDDVTKVINVTLDQTSYNTTLSPDTIHDWRVRAWYFDPNDGAEYDNESRSAYQRFTTAP